MRGHLQAGLTIVAMLSLFAIAIDASDNYTVNYGTNQSITAHTECRKVTNASATGASVYVPTQTDAEWQSFYTNPPAGVTTSGCVTPGSQTFSTAGTYSFTVPEHNSITVQVWGGGGGGGGKDGAANIAGGSNGGTSSWASAVIAGGGARATVSAGGAGGTASGGTTNTSGAAGTTAGKGGNGANGGLGGAALPSSDPGPGNPGSAPGGGGGGAALYTMKTGVFIPASGGGGGSYSTRTYTSGTYTPGSSVTIVVGAAGAGGNGTAQDGGRGGAGRVIVTWN